MKNETIENISEETNDEFSSDEFSDDEFENATYENLNGKLFLTPVPNFWFLCTYVIHTYIHTFTQ